MLSVAIENNQNKAALLSSEERCHLLADNSPLGIIIHDKDTIHYVNMKCSKLQRLLVENS